MENPSLRRAPADDPRSAIAMKREGKATGGDAKRKAIDACHAIMRESHFSLQPLPSPCPAPAPAGPAPPAHGRPPLRLCTASHGQPPPATAGRAPLRLRPLPLRPPPDSAALAPAAPTPAAPAPAPNARHGHTWSPAPAHALPCRAAAAPVSGAAVPSPRAATLDRSSLEFGRIPARSCAGAVAIC
nr:uncharacterized protein LOC127347815 [Lolium perenne]